MHKIAFMKIYKCSSPGIVIEDNIFIIIIIFIIILYIFVFVIDASVISVYSALLWSNYLSFPFKDSVSPQNFVSKSQTNYDIKRS